MPRLISVTALVLAAIALVVSLLRGEPAPVPQVQPDPRTDEDVAAVERRLELLEESVRDLDRRVADLNHRPTFTLDSGVANGPALVQEIEQLRAEVRGMVAGEALQSEGGKAYLKDAVRTVSEELAMEQRKALFERMEVARTRSAAASAEGWKRFVTAAHLDYAQEQALNRRLEAEEAVRKSATEQLRAGTKTYADVRTETRASRAATDEEMKKALNEDQYKQFTEKRREERRGGGGGDNRGGRPEQGADTGR